MKRRCKDSVFIKKFNLKDFRLTFRSIYRAADIEKKKIQLSQVVSLKFQKVMKKNWTSMKTFQYYIKKFILNIIVN